MSEYRGEPDQSAYNAPGPAPVLRGPNRTKPILVWILIGFTVTAYLAQMLFEQLYGFDLLFVLFGKINEEILRGQYWRLITPVFLHGGILHLLANMYALYILGRNNEMLNGHLRFGLVYFLAAFGGNVLSFVLGKSPSLGASTATFGLLAAEAVFVWQNKSFFGKSAGRTLLNYAMIVGVNLMIGLTSGSRIDNWGHLGGLIAGFFFAFQAGVRWGIERVDGYPSFVDRRDTRDIVLAACLVFGAFAAIAAIPFFR